MWQEPVTSRAAPANSICMKAGVGLDLVLSPVSCMPGKRPSHLRDVKGEPSPVTVSNHSWPRQVRSHVERTLATPALGLSRARPPVQSQCRADFRSLERTFTQSSLHGFPSYCAAGPNFPPPLGQYDRFGSHRPSYPAAPE